MHAEREYLLRRIAILDNLLEHMRLDPAGDHNEFKSDREPSRRRCKRLNDLDDTGGAI
jgi:hypothetical protein